MNNLGIVLFTTTKGHFGRKDLYKHGVQQWDGKADQYYAHIKVTPGEESIADEMEKYLASKGYFVERTHGKWSHNETSHSFEYTKDITKAFNSSFVHGATYSIFLEDDWVIKGDIDFSLQEALSCLEDEKDTLAVRWNNEDEGLSGLNGSYNYRCTTLCRQLQDYTPYGPTFTFQPTLVRTRDIYQAYRLIGKHWEQMQHVHIELASGYGFKALSDSDTPFYFVHPDTACSVHIGEEPFEERIK